jgi:cytoskeleton-associated protein 5
MPEGEEDFSSLPFPDRFAHKNWKVRKGGYEDAKQQFEKTGDESDPIFVQFQDASLWKGAVTDSNVAAQQDGLAAYCAFLQYGGPAGCARYLFPVFSICNCWCCGPELD